MSHAEEAAKRDATDVFVVKAVCTQLVRVHYGIVL